MKRARFALLAAVIGLAACGGPAIPPAQNYATISGRVYDTDSNAAVAGAVVTGSVVLTATSAADGTYKIENFPIGPNEVQVTPPAGYTAVQSQYTISPQKGETLKIDIALKKNP
jgi:ABC-type glycerol-3-phosphate transport system substrate-binding protein